MSATTQLDLASWLDLRARVEPAELSPGQAATLVVEAVIPAGGHIESNAPPEPFMIPTVLDVAPVPHADVGPVRYPTPVEKTFSWTSLALQVYEGTVRLEAPVRVSPNAPAGALRISAELRYQACTNNACLPPNAQSVESVVDVRG